MRLRGNAVVLLGGDDLFDAFEQLATLSRQDVDEYAARLRATNTISDIQRAYGDLIGLLRKEVRPSDTSRWVACPSPRARTSRSHAFRRGRAGRAMGSRAWFLCSRVAATIA
jgi:hypothetical protein